MSIGNHDDVLRTVAGLPRVQYEINHKCDRLRKTVIFFNNNDASIAHVSVVSVTEINLFSFSVKQCQLHI